MAHLAFEALDTTGVTAAPRDPGLDQRPLADVAQELTLEAVLEIWQSATDRLEQTHLTLQQEIRRLTHEVEEKNRLLAKKDRLADLGQMAAHVAHEVRNNLMPMTLYMSLLKRQLYAQSSCSAPSADKSIGLLEKIELGVTSMRAMVSDLLNFTTDRQAHFSAVELSGMLVDLLEEIRPQCEAQQVSLESEVPPQTTVCCDADMIKRALRNLLLNALDATGGGGRVRLEVQTNAASIEIRVLDSGPGVRPIDRQRLFDPFYTTKETGTGLGLSIVERIVASHGGQIEVEDGKLGGAMFTMRWPLPEASNAPSATQQ